MGRMAECKGVWILVVFFMLMQSGCFLPYVTKMGYYQAKLLWGRESIEKVLKSNKDLTPNQREKLELILAVRKFTQEKLHFTPRENYTTVNLSWNHPLWNVSASEALHFKFYQWWFPIVGYIPQKGFFSKEEAIAQRDVLKKQGYDVLLRPVAGYSSIGYFNDPVWPEMLDWPTEVLVELMIHELAHATLYFKNQPSFDESFANAVAHIGTLQFLKDRYGEESVPYKNAKSRLADEERYGSFMKQLYADLDKLYRSEKPVAEKFLLKKDRIDLAKEHFTKIPFESESFQKAKLKDLNNASLMVFELYNSNQKCFQRLFEQVYQDWRVFLDKLRTLEKESDPLNALCLKLQN